MIKNFFKVAIRYLLRNKGYTAINILGLAIGITCCTLIMLFVRNEFSYDKFHKKSDRIYRSWVLEKYQGQDDIVDIVTPLPLAGALKAGFPEIESAVRVMNFNILVRVDQNSFSDNVVMVDSSFFNIFDFQLLIGDRKNPFPQSTSIILTEETAKKYFGSSDPIGKTIELPLAGDSIPFTVSGIVKSAPEESSIKFNALISFENEHSIFLPNTLKNWFNVNPETYVLLKKDVDPDKLQAKFPSMVKQHLGADYKEGMYLVNLQPLTKIHLDTSLPPGLQPTSNPKYSYILITIGILILLVACINFITLSIGRSATRALEVGVRKVLGAERHQLTRQFWGEAILLTLVSVIIGIVLAFLLVKPFSQVINRQLALHIDLVFLAYCFLITLVIGLIAGIYPALILSGFKPIEVLKGKLKMGSNPGWLHRALISGQFIASIIMIICTIVIGRQLNYMQHTDLGYNKEHVVIVSTNKPRIVGTELARIYSNELLKYSQVKQATYSLMSFAESPWVQVGFTDDKKIYRDFQFNVVDAAFVKTMGLKIVRGRDFSKDNPGDQLGSIIVNESLVKMFGWKDPIGQKLSENMEPQIVGVVKDFHFQSLHTKIQPLVMLIKPDSFYRRIENIMTSAPTQPRISVLLNPGNLSANIATLKEAWHKVAPNQEFEYRFLDDSIQLQYLQEQRSASIVKIASALSIFIACMGLFGLATLTVVRRTREIGIRKVLGASVGGIVRLLSKEFLILVIIAAVIAFPLAWWLMNKWLEDFAYRIHIAWWIFPLAGIITLLIALCTVSFQAIKAAIANPVKSLRTE